MRALIGLLLLSLCLPSLAEDKVLNIYSWSSYIPEKGLQQFKDETGIAVKYDIFDSAEALDSTLRISRMTAAVAGQVKLHAEV